MEYGLKTDRLVLKPLSELDIAFIQELESRPETYKYDWGTALSADKIESGCRWFIEKQKSLPNGGAIRWIVIYDDKKIGEVHVDCINDKSHEWEIGWHILPEYWGKGFATEAVTAVIKHAFTHFNIQRIVAVCHIENIKSISLAKRVGMLKAGRMRESLLINGIYYDEYVFSVFKHEVIK